MRKIFALFCWNPPFSHEIGKRVWKSRPKLTPVSCGTSPGEKWKTLVYIWGLNGPERKRIWWAAHIDTPPADGYNKTNMKLLQKMPQRQPLSKQVYYRQKTNQRWKKNLLLSHSWGEQPIRPHTPTGEPWFLLLIVRIIKCLIFMYH